MKRKPLLYGVTNERFVVLGALKEPPKSKFLLDKGVSQLALILRSEALGHEDEN